VELDRQRAPSGQARPAGCQGEAGIVTRNRPTGGIAGEPELDALDGLPIIEPCRHHARRLAPSEGPGS
jgi:hypothetical protein